MYIENPEAVGNPDQSPTIVPDTPEEADAFRAIVESNRRALGMPPQALAEGLADAVTGMMARHPDYSSTIAKMEPDEIEVFQSAVQDAIEAAWEAIVPKGAMLVSKEFLERSHERTERIKCAVAAIRDEDDPDAPGRPWLVEHVLAILLDLQQGAARKEATEAQAGQ